VGVFQKEQLRKVQEQLHFRFQKGYWQGYGILMLVKAVLLTLPCEICYFVWLLKFQNQLVEHWLMVTKRLLHLQQLLIEPS
jgi:hypothetical protein